MLSQTALESFKKIYQEELGVELEDAEAVALAVNLLTIFNKVYRPIKKEWFEKIINENDSSQNYGNK